MSAHTHHGRVIPECINCGDDAVSVVTNTTGEALPSCAPCATGLIQSGTHREYPIEAYYTPSNRRVSAFDPDQPEFDLFDPDESHIAWMSADNHDAKSSVYLDDYE